MKKKLFVLLFAVGLLSSCDNSSYEIMSESDLEQNSEENLSEAQTRSNLSMQDYSIKNLQSLVGHQVWISLNTTATSDIYLTKKPISSGSAPWVSSRRESNSGNVDEQYWTLVSTNSSYNGKPVFGIKTITCDKVLSKGDKGSSNGQTTVREPIGNRIYNLYDNRDLWMFEYDENARSYLLVNLEVPSMCLVRKAGANASNPLQLIPRSEILYHHAHWNVASVETYELVSIKYLSTDSNIELEEISETDVLFDNTSSKPFEYEKTYERSISNEAFSSWSKEFTLGTNVEIAAPKFVGLKVSASTTNKWLSGGSSKTIENVSLSIKVKQTIPSNDILKITLSAIKYKGTVNYEAVVRGSKGESKVYGKWDGAIHQDIRITLSDNTSSSLVDESQILTRYTRW